MTFGKEKILEFVTDDSRSHSLENSLWRRLWTCSKTDNVMNGHNKYLSLLAEQIM